MWSRRKPESTKREGRRPSSTRRRDASAESSSSCARSARRTSRTGLKALDSTAASGSAASVSVRKTGMITRPRVFPIAVRIARPTACTTSTWLPRGSTNATASNAGTSMPSVRHRALVMSVGTSGLRSRSTIRLRSPVGIVPATWPVAGTGGVPLTRGSQRAKARALAIYEWKEIERRRPSSAIARRRATRKASDSASVVRSAAWTMALRPIRSATSVSVTATTTTS